MSLMRCLIGVLIAATVLLTSPRLVLADDPCDGPDAIASHIASQLNAHVSQVAAGGQFKVSRSDVNGVPTGNLIRWVRGGQVVFSETVTAGSDMDGWVDLKVLAAPAVGIEVDNLQGNSIGCKSYVALRDQRFASSRELPSAKASGTSSQPISGSLSSASSAVSAAARQAPSSLAGAAAAIFGQLGATGTTKSKKRGADTSDAAPVVPAPVASPEPATPAITPAAPAASSAGPTILRMDGVGPVKIGMSLADAEKALGDKLAMDPMLSDECNQGSAKKAYSTLTFMTINRVIARIDTNDPAVRTPEGAHVGSTEQEIRKMYGARAVFRTNQYEDKWHDVEVISNDGRRLGIVFATDGKKVVSMRVGREAEIRLVEGCV